MQLSLQFGPDFKLVALEWKHLVWSLLAVWEIKKFVGMIPFYNNIWRKSHPSTEGKWVFTIFISLTQNYIITYTYNFVILQILGNI